MISGSSMDELYLVFAGISLGSGMLLGLAVRWCRSANRAIQLALD